MKQREMEKLTTHFDTYFSQNDCRVLHPLVDDGFHVDVLIYEPNEKFPFWKLCTMGASDYKMPAEPNSLALNNEYMMFVDASVDLTDTVTLQWYSRKLLLVASFAYENEAFISYGHSFEWQNEDPEDEMIAAFIEFPQIIPDVGVLRCKLGMFKTVACLQVVLLNKADLEKLMEIGPQAFSEYLYPEDDSAPHFLSEQHRSDRF
ncbi:MAG: suppressor of fused domain protein [Clostridia bacterium]|nr:suppressor of fused domain protein [Clostridia bacterium]